eukprot:scpid60372/ scgid9831/ Targeting protein for Xklp2-B
MATDVFSCEYDAPMYVDFSSIDQPSEDDRADAWFDAAAAKEAGGDGGMGDMFAEGPEGILDEEEDAEEDATDGDAGTDDQTEEITTNGHKDVTSPGTRSHGMMLRKGSTSSATSNISTSSNVARKAVSSASKKPKLTMPETPDFVRRGRQKLTGAGHAVKSSEQLEMERINKMREKHRKAVQASQESFRQLHTTAGSACAALPKRAAVAPTIPVGFNFRTESRLAKNASNSRPAEGTQPDGSGKFVHQLRSYNAPKSVKGPVKARHGPVSPTHPKPFKFHQTRAQSRQADKENTVSSGKPVGAAAKYVSAAEHLKKFQNATPDRYRTLPGSEINKGPIQPKNGTKAPAPRMTMPVTPKLMSKTRHRPPTLESQAEKEEKELDEIKAYQFRARKLDPRIITENGSYGLPKRTTPKTTVAVALRLQTSKRCDDRASKDTHGNTPQKTFRAQPIPDKMFEQPIGIPEKSAVTLTDAKTPNIRKCKRKADDIMEAQAKRVASENEVPHGLTPPRNTVVEPFDLQTDVRGAHKVEQWRQRMAQEEEDSRRAKEFHARPATVVYEAPFVPEPAQRGPIVTDDVVLHSDVRAEKRQEFDCMRNEKELEMAEEQHRRKMENEEREREEVERIRAGMVHKAKPVRHYRTVEVKPSERPLTKPTSPAFSHRITEKYHRGRTPH